ncbi:MAG: S-adenosylmethionine decarboxylase [Acidobacteria bacterium]|nr:S-adenosylmethionine decarboxylase [Acidobacteriota bacterium]
MERDQYKNICIDGQRYYGKHLMVTAESCNDKLIDLPTVTQFLKDVADRIGMIRYGEPVCARFGDGCQVGISGVQLITTSAITIHTNDEMRDMYLDVFSCNWFSESLVYEMIDELFSPQNQTHQIVIRK